MRIQRFVIITYINTRKTKHRMMSGLKLISQELP